MKAINLGIRRIQLAVTKLKKSLGRDPSMAELIHEGLSEAEIKSAVRDEILAKYRVQQASGSFENRFKLKKDIFTLNR